MKHSEETTGPGLVRLINTMMGHVHCLVEPQFSLITDHFASDIVVRAIHTFPNDSDRATVRAVISSSYHRRLFFLAKGWLAEDLPTDAGIHHEGLVCPVDRPRPRRMCHVRRAGVLGGQQAQQSMLYGVVHHRMPRRDRDEVLAQQECDVHHEEGIVVRLDQIGSPFLADPRIRIYIDSTLTKTKGVSWKV